MKVIICGAGIAGLSAARFMAKKGWEVVVIEKVRGLRMAGYMMDLVGSGYDAAEKSEILPKLQARHHEFTEVAYVKENGKLRSKIDYKLFSASLGGRLLALLRGDVERVLHDVLPNAVELRYSTTITGVAEKNSGVSVTLSTGEILNADLLIGADGIHSSIRKMVFGPEENYLRYLGYHTAAFVFEDAELATKLQGKFMMLSVANRQVGLSSVGGDKISAFFAHKASEPIHPQNVKSELRRVYGDLAWYVPKMLELVDQTDDIYYDWMAQIEMPSWSKGRVVLLGDACYAVSLLAGQGASMAIGGAYMLAEYIGDGDIENGLVQYEQDMKPEILKKQAAGRKTAHWFVPPSEFRNVIRDTFLNLTRLPGLSHLLRFFLAPSLKSVVKD